MRRYVFGSRAEAEDAYKQKSSENDRLRIVTQALLCGNVDGVFRAHPYTVRLIGALRACGGIALVTFAPRGQSPASEARYLDEFYAEISRQTRLSSCPDLHRIHSLLSEACKRRNELIAAENERERAARSEAVA